MPYCLIGRVLSEAKELTNGLKYRGTGVVVIFVTRSRSLGAVSTTFTQRIDDEDRCETKLAECTTKSTAGKQTNAWIHRQRDSQTNRSRQTEGYTDTDVEMKNIDQKPAPFEYFIRSKSTVKNDKTRPF
jgi:hypothetical protein